LCRWCHKSLHEEGYKPCDFPEVVPPWDRKLEDNIDSMNQEYNW